MQSAAALVASRQFALPNDERDGFSLQLPSILRRGRAVLTVAIRHDDGEMAPLVHDGRLEPDREPEFRELVRRDLRGKGVTSNGASVSESEPFVITMRAATSVGSWTTYREDRPDQPSTNRRRMFRILNCFGAG